MAVITTGQITISDLNDVDISKTEPTSPVLDQLWLDTSVVPNELKRWDGSKWVIVGDSRVEGRNLLLNSGVEVSNANYRIHTYIPSTPMVAGETYTLTLCVTPAEGATYFNPNVSRGYRVIANFQVSGTNKQILSRTFIADYAAGRTPEDNIRDADVMVYRLPNDGTVTGASTIHFIKLEKGPIATPWTPAPEDLEQKVTTLSASVDILAGEITSKASKSEVNGLTSRVSSVEQKILPDTLVTEIAKTTTYTNDKITVASTAPSSPVTGKLWLDTSKAPHALMRWSGSAWAKASPQDAADVGAYTKGQVYTKEETATQLQLKFDEFQVGGENLLKESHRLSDKFESYQGSTYSVLEDGIKMGDWGAESATRVRTTALGTSELKARWSISTDMDFMAAKPMVFSFYAKNNRTDSRVVISTNRIGEPITLDYGESRKLEFIGVQPENESKFLIMEVRAPLVGMYVDVTLWHPKWELGDKPTEWSPHPEEFYAGVTKINREGIEVSKSNTDVTSSMKNDGFRVLDGDNITGSLVNGVASFPELNSERVIGDVINTHPGGTINIGAGYEYSSISEALQDMGNRRHLLADLTFRVYSTITDDITIRGFTGGMVYIAIMSGGAIYGSVLYYQNSSTGYVYGYSKRELIRGGIRVSGTSSLYVRDLNIDPNDTTVTGLISEYGATAFITNCDIVRCRFGVIAQYGGTVMALNNIGNVPGGNAVYNTYNGGVLHARGTMPLGSPKFGGTTTAFVYDAGTTQGASGHTPPPTTTPTLLTQTFNPTKIETYSFQYGAVSSYYPNQAAQNRWDTGTGLFEGRITFGGAVRNYINDRNGDTGLKVELQLRRYSGTNGKWGPVAPTYSNHFSITGGSFGSVDKGAWSGWVTVSPTLISTAGYTFKFGNNTTGDTYAVWDAARIRVTKTKNI